MVFLSRLLGVYPRVCGGTFHCSQYQRSVSGLSPRVRGNLIKTGVQMLSRGSIPACAGEPDGAPPRPGEHGVYPRVCGGTRRGEEIIAEGGGLSPRVRGNR